jgi:hypothetical protein
MPVRGNASSITEKWGRRTSGAVQDYLAGVGRVSVAPGQLAAANQQGMLNGIQEAINSGRWAESVSRVSLAEWKRSTEQKGAARLASGVQNAMPKMQGKMQNLIAAIESAQAEIANIPRTTFEQRLQRMNGYSVAMHRFKGKI